MSHSIQEYDVTVVGAGACGLSCAKELKLRGFPKVVILDQSSTNDDKHPGYVHNGLWDHFTRYQHGHGDEQAKLMWNFADSALNEFLKFCEQFKIKTQQQDKVRMVTSEHELQEVQKAHQLLKKSRLLENLEKEWGVSERILALHFDQSKSIYFSIQQFFDALRNTLNIINDSNDIEFNFKEDKYHIKTKQNHICSKFIVLANDMNLVKFLPQLKDSLTTTVSEWHDIHYTRLPKFWREPGRLFSSQYNHEWYLSLGEQKLRIGGARFLRPLAGVGVDSAKWHAPIAQYLQEQLRRSFRSLHEQEYLRRGSCYLECLTCDELPLLGPMFGDDRILIGTGFMSSPLSQAYLAGKYLAEIIATGKCVGLPKIFSPKRLRSLKES